MDALIITRLKKIKNGLHWASEESVNNRFSFCLFGLVKKTAD